LCRQYVRNESGRKGEIAPSRPALRRIGIAQARTDGRAGRVGRENRVCGVDRRIGSAACLLPQDGCRAERTSIGSEGKGEKQDSREASGTNGTNGANGANRADKGTSVPNFFGFRL